MNTGHSGCQKERGFFKDKGASESVRKVKLTSGISLGKNVVN